MAMALGIVSGLVSAVGSIAQASAQAASAKYNAKVAERNKRAVTAQTINEVEDQRLRNRRTMGSIRAAYGANGFEMAGSPLDVISDTAVEQELDVAKIKYQGAMKAEGYSEQATLFKMEAKADTTAGFFGAASGLLGGLNQGMA